MYTCGRAFVGDNGGDSAPQSVDVFTFHLDDLETMAFESLLQLIALKIFGRVARNGDIVIICTKLYQLTYGE